ncbi:1148_t:CDS:2, partial [Entrophospora sp. SA101]
QKAHRRNMSLSVGGVGSSNDSSENLLNMPSIFESPNLFPINNEKPGTILSPPPTPSKQKHSTKSFEPQPYISTPDNFDFKKIVFLIVFLWAVVVFLASLGGIGPVDNELLLYNNRDSHSSESEYDEEVTVTVTEQLPLPITESIVVIPTTININENPELSDNSLNSEQLGVFNKLRKKKKTKYEVNENIYNITDSKIIVDYSNYTYIAAKPHFTHIDVIQSLSTEDLDEFSALKIAQQNTDDSLDHSCGSWQKTYIKLHEDILNGVESQRYVSYVCDSKVNCGGLTERILGMTSTFLFALLTDRAFLADWQVPFPLDTIFNSPNIDWSYDSLDPDDSIKNLQTSELNIIDYDPENLDYHFLSTNWTTRYPDSFIKLYTNQGLIIQKTFNSKYYSTKLKEIGLRPHTAFSCVLDYLFRPVAPALSFITEYSALFALPSIFSVGIHIRTGNTFEQDHLLQDYSHFFRCAEQLRETYAAPDQKGIYYLVTDSNKLRESYTKLENVIISGLPINTGHSNYDHPDDVNNAIIENWILGKTDFRVISQGGIGKLAAFHSKQLHSTVLLPPIETNFVDCTPQQYYNPSSVPSVSNETITGRFLINNSSISNLNLIDIVNLGKLSNNNTENCATIPNKILNITSKGTIILEDIHFPIETNISIYNNNSQEKQNVKETKTPFGNDFFQNRNVCDELNNNSHDILNHNNKRNFSDLDFNNSSSDPTIKPPFTYASLIGQAILSCSSKKMTLGEIYTWITYRYPYYKKDHKGWMNSIRHNLSLHSVFVKESNVRNGRKGGYWTILPEFRDCFVNGIYRHEKMSTYKKQAIKAEKEPSEKKSPENNKTIIVTESQQTQPHVSQNDIDNILPIESLVGPIDPFQLVAEPQQTHTYMSQNEVNDLSSIENNIESLIGSIDTFPFDASNIDEDLIACVNATDNVDLADWKSICDIISNLPNIDDN